MKKIAMVIVLISLMFGGCATKNEQYKDFKRSPCATKLEKSLYA